MSNLPPVKQIETRDRFYFLESEVNLLIEAARKTKRHGARNALLILIMFRHGLRTEEAINLKWAHIDLNTGHIHVQRCKNGKDSTQPLRGRELRGLRQLQRDYDQCPYVFSSERKSPLSSRAIRKIIASASIEANLKILARPHMLRHSCGFYLASKGIDTRAIQDYLGHKNIHHTVRYTQLSPDRFKDFWRD